LGSRIIKTYISSSLYEALIKEKNRLQLNEKKKIKSTRKRITLYTASNSLARRL